jgi:hypothetical protein
MATLRIKITMKDGNVIEVDKELAEARSLLGDVPTNGYRDPITLRFYPAESIHTIEVIPPTEFPGFSVN